MVTIAYGNSTTGYGHATVVAGPRGGWTVISHDGDHRRVTKRALIATARAIRGGETHPSVITTAGDAIPAWEAR